MRKLSPGWQDLTDLQWQEACRREAVIRPLAERQEPEWVRRRALAAVACFQSAPRTRGSHGCTQKKGVSRSLAERFNCKKASLLNELAAKSPPERVAERFNCK
jgi:hypothetical protein